MQYIKQAKHYSFFSILLSLLLTACGGANNDNNKAQTDTYETLSQSINTGLAKPNVVEFFYYRCSHCKRYQAPFHNWVQSNPNVNVELIPMASGKSEASAKAFYVAKKLGKLESFHTNFFTAVAEQESLFYSKDEIKAYFQQNLNIASTQFEAAWDSQEVSNAIIRAVNLKNQSQLKGVPFFMVNGKYHVFNQKDATNTFTNIESLLNK